MKEQNSFFKSFNLVGFGILMSRLTGFFRDLIFANILGVGIISDAFFASFKIPNTLRKIFAEGGLIMAFTPVFAPIIKNERKNAISLASSVLSFLIISLLATILLMQILMPYIIKIVNPGFKSGETFLLSVKYSRVSIFFIFFMSITALFGAILNSIGKFFYYAFATVVFNITIVIFGLFLIKSNIFDKGFYLTFALVLGGITQLIFVFIGNIKNNLIIFPKKIKFDDKMKEFLSGLPASVLSSHILNIFIDMIFASFFVGGMSYIYYTDRIGMLPISIIGYTISVIILPSLSKMIKSNDFTSSNKLQQDAVIFSLFISIPISLFFFFFSTNIVEIIYSFSGKLTSADKNIISIMLKIYSISIPFNILLKITTAIFFASGFSIIPVLISINAIIVNILFNVFFMKKLGINCMLYASTLSAILNTSFAFYYLTKAKIYKPNIWTLILNNFYTFILSIIIILLIHFTILFLLKFLYLKKLIFILVSSFFSILYLFLIFPFLKKTEFLK